MFASTGPRLRPGCLLKPSKPANLSRGSFAAGRRRMFNASEKPSNETQGTRTPEIAPKTATDNKWRRARLKKQRQALEASGEAFLYTHCLFCNKEIKASFRRPYCPGGFCYEQYRKAKPVRRVVPWAAIDRRISTQVLAA